MSWPLSTLPDVALVLPAPDVSNSTFMFGHTVVTGLVVALNASGILPVILQLAFVAPATGNTAAQVVKRSPKSFREVDDIQNDVVLKFAESSIYKR